jgi:hypothetical protein
LLKEAPVEGESLARAISSYRISGAKRIGDILSAHTIEASNGDDGFGRTFHVAIHPVSDDHTHILDHPPSE